MSLCSTAVVAAVVPDVLGGVDDVSTRDDLPLPPSHQVQTLPDMCRQGRFSNSCQGRGEAGRKGHLCT